MLALKNKSSLRRIGLRQHLAWGGDTSGKEGVGRLASQHPQGCLASLWPLRLSREGEEGVTGQTFTGRVPSYAHIDAQHWVLERQL